MNNESTITLAYYENGAVATSLTITIDAMGAALPDILRAVVQVLRVAGHPVSRVIAEYDTEKFGTVQHSSDDD